MRENISIKDKYKPAMEMTDREEALEYFEKCVEHTMAFGSSREEAIEIEKSNFGYYAGYYDHDIRIRVEELFGSIHPIFGSTKNGEPTQEGAFKMGQDLTKETE